MNNIDLDFVSLIAFVRSENPDGFSTRSKFKSMNAICLSFIWGCPLGAKLVLNFGDSFPDANGIKYFIIL